MLGSPRKQNCQPNLNPYHAQFVESLGLEQLSSLVRDGYISAQFAQKITTKRKTFTR